MGKYTLAFMYLATTNESLRNQGTESLMIRTEGLGEWTGSLKPGGGC